MRDDNKNLLESRLCRSCRSLILKNHLSESEFQNFKDCRCLSMKTKSMEVKK